MCVTDLVLAELASGARTGAREDDLRRVLRSFGWVDMDVTGDLDGAALIYRACRKVGVTPRGLADCVIANVAMRTGASLLARDGDFDAIAAVVSLRLDL